MKKRSLYPLLATVLSPLALLVGWYGYGTAQNLGPATLLLMYGFMLLFLVGIAAVICVVAVGIRHFCLNRSSREEHIIASASVAFLLVFWFVRSFQLEAFVYGAKARTNSLGGPSFVAKLLSESEFLARDADPSWGGDIPEGRIPQEFRKIGCKNVSLRPNLGFVHLGVSGAFFPSGWWLVKDETDFRPPPDYHQVYPHLYRFEK